MVHYIVDRGTSLFEKATESEKHGLGIVVAVGKSLIGPVALSSTFHDVPWTFPNPYSCHRAWTPSTIWAGGENLSCLFCFFPSHCFFLFLSLFFCFFPLFFYSSFFQRNPSCFRCGWRLNLWRAARRDAFWDDQSRQPQELKPWMPSDFLNDVSASLNVRSRFHCHSQMPDPRIPCHVHQSHPSSSCDFSIISSICEEPLGDAPMSPIGSPCNSGSLAITVTWSPRTWMVYHNT